MNISKAKISKILSNHENISSEFSKDFVNTFFELKRNILKTKNLKLNKFGSYYKGKSPSRIGRNPKTMQEYVIPSKSKITFRPSSIIKKILN